MRCLRWRGWRKAMGIGAEVVKVVKAVGVITLIGFAYWYGSRETDRLVITASDAAYNAGKNETETTLLAKFAIEKENVRREADAAGFARGQSELALSRDEDTALAQLVVQAFALLQDPKILAQLSTETARSISDAGDAVKREDFEGASLSLPQLVELLPDRSCVESTQTFEAKENDAFDLCESGSEIVVTRVQLGIACCGADVAIDGEEQFRLLGERFVLKNNCYLTLQRVMEKDGLPVIQMRAGC